MQYRTDNSLHGGRPRAPESGRYRAAVRCGVHRPRPGPQADAGSAGQGRKLPFDLEGSAIYYVGPTPERPGEVIGSAGPTTSGRMDAMSPRLLDLGNKIMIGKGKRDAAVKEAVVRNGAVYLAALGGAGALMAQSVKTLEVIAWPDLGCEAVRRLTVEKMPLTVILDAHGGDLYTSGPAAYLETVK